MQDSPTILTCIMASILCCNAIIVTLIFPSTYKFIMGLLLITYILFCGLTSPQTVILITVLAHVIMIWRMVKNKNYKAELASFIKQMYSMVNQMKELSQ